MRCVGKSPMLESMLLVIGSLLLVYVAAAINFDAKHVKLEVYVDSGCPVCKEFILGELTNVLAKDDIVAILDYKYVPFGTNVENPNGTFTCWDENECKTDSLELCSLYLLAGHIEAINTGASSYDMFPFASCMFEANGDPTYAKGCWDLTMEPFYSTNSSLSWTSIDECSIDQFDQVMHEGSEAAPDDLTAVPYVLVDGKHLNNPDTTLLAAICLAYDGEEKPASCPGQ